MNDMLILRSAIKEELLFNFLKRGTALALIGILPLLFGALFLNTSQLGNWGLLIYFFSMGLIALGLIPYRRLLRLQKSPNELILCQDDTLIFKRRGKQLLKIPFHEIAQVRFIEENKIYGIGIDLKINRPTKKKQLGCDFFFPYFTKRSFERMKKVLDA